MAAREALRGRSELLQGLPGEWFDALSSTDDLIWRTCVNLFARLGRAPNFAELAAETGVPKGSMKSLLGALQRRDLLGLSSDGGALEYVYPFTMRDTGHHVYVHGHTLNVLCAIDALGVGAMCRTDVTIESRGRAATGRPHGGQGFERAGDSEALRQCRNERPPICTPHIARARVAFPSELRAA
jgi:hypothetical protein